MSAKLRALSTTTFLIAGLTMLTAAAKAADLVAEPHAGVSPRATSAVHRWNRCCWAHGQFVAGVRGASPLTVPFFGHGWYPGPVYYRSPPPYCCEGEDAAISVRY